MTVSRLGPLVVASQIEKAIAEHLSTPDPDTGGTWIGTGLGMVERAGDYEPGSIERPHGVISQSEFAKWPEDQVPVVLVICPGLTGRPVRRADGIYEARWGVGLAAIVSDVDEDATEQLAKSYGAALRFAMLAKPSLGGISQGVSWIDEKYDEIPKRRNLAAARVVFEVIVEQAVKISPLAAPVADPDSDPGPWPTATEITTDVRPRTLTEVL